MNGGRFKELVVKARSCRHVLLGIIFYVYFLDYMLFTALVPILPELLVESDTEALTDQSQATSYVVSPTTNSSFHPVKSEVLGDVYNRSKTVGTEINANQSSQVALTRRGVKRLNATSENTRVGWLLSSKALVQIVVSPVIGVLSNRIAYKNLLLFGTAILMTSASIFAGSGSFLPLLVARALQGLGSAAISISGMSLLAENYTDDKERSRATGTAMSGIGVGVLVGYPFGGLIFAALGSAVPFIGIAVLCLIGICVQVQMTDRSNLTTKYDVSPLSMWRLCKDPYILICTGALLITAMSFAVLESTVPIWVMDTMQVEQWEIGIIFIPDSLGYLIGVYAFPVIAKKYGRWIFTLVPMVVAGVGAIILPFCKQVEELIFPHLLLGLGVGVTDSAIYPLLALLVDQRHVATYGSVYAIGQFAICLAFFIGPAIAGQIVPIAGFEWCMWGVAILNIGFAPVCIFLRDPPVLDDKQTILDSMEDETVYRGDSNNEIFSYHTFDGISAQEK